MHPQIKTEAIFLQFLWVDKFELLSKTKSCHCALLFMDSRCVQQIADTPLLTEWWKKDSYFQTYF